MDNDQKMFYDFIMERTQDGNQEAMAAVLENSSSRRKRAVLIRMLLKNVLRS